MCLTLLLTFSVEFQPLTSCEPVVASPPTKKIRVDKPEGICVYSLHVCTSLTTVYSMRLFRCLFACMYKKTLSFLTPGNKENFNPAGAAILPDCRRLPIPCPLPTSFSKRVQKSLERGILTGNVKLTFLREAFTFYFGICPEPEPHEYDMMCATLCNKFPELKDKLPEDEKKPWVS